MIVVCYLLTLYLLVIFARIVLSWFPLEGGGVMATVQDVLITLTEPVLGRVRRVMPRPGNVPLDLSPLVVILAIYVLRAVLC
jgi:YggT family protein